MHGMHKVLMDNCRPTQSPDGLAFVGDSIRDVFPEGPFVNSTLAAGKALRLRGHATFRVCNQAMESDVSCLLLAVEALH